MEKSVYITSLEHELIEVKIQNPKKLNLEFLKDEVEGLTNIIGPFQIYYSFGKEVQNLDCAEWSVKRPLELIESNPMPVIHIMIYFRNRVYPVYVGNFEKKYLLCLKLAIEKKMNSLGVECPFDAQMLKIDGIELPSSFPLASLAYNSRIDLDVNTFLPQRSAVTMYEVEEYMDVHKDSKTTLVMRGAKLEVKVDNRAAKWRKLDKGFSIQCYCRNRECEARNRMVVANLGFGVYSLETIGNRIICPVCGESCQEIITAGFYMAGWKFKGIIQENSVSGEEKTWNNYYVWREYFDEWTKLRFSVRPNQN